MSNRHVYMQSQIYQNTEEILSKGVLQGILEIFVKNLVLFQNMVPGVRKYAFVLNKDVMFLQDLLKRNKVSNFDKRNSSNVRQ